MEVTGEHDELQSARRSIPAPSCKRAAYRRAGASNAESFGCYRAERLRKACSTASGNVKIELGAARTEARLLVSKVDPWSVLKMAFLLSVALGIVTVVAAIVLWTVLDLTGIFDRVNGLLDQIAGSETGPAFDLRTYASLGQVASFATIIAVVNVVLLTALAMLSAILYNISSTLVGGIGVTLTDD